LQSLQGGKQGASIEGIIQSPRRFISSRGKCHRYHDVKGEEKKIFSQLFLLFPKATKIAQDCHEDAEEVKTCSPERFVRVRSVRGAKKTCDFATSPCSEDYHTSQVRDNCKKIHCRFCQSVRVLTFVRLSRLPVLPKRTRLLLVVQQTRRWKSHGCVKGIA
jgi:hypothetical protein